jgi:hypothetical protein
MEKLLLRALENIRFVRGLYGCVVGIKEWYSVVVKALCYKPEGRGFETG